MGSQLDELRTSLDSRAESADRHSTRTDLVAREIKQWILTRALEPGAKLPNETELLQIFKCSRGTIRECLKSLEAVGLVKIVRGAGGGAQVAEIEAEKVAESLRIYTYFQHMSWDQIFEVRRSVEPQIAASVFGKLTEEDFGRLEETIGKCSDNQSGCWNTRSHRLAELDFHRILAERCDNPLLRLISLLVIDLIADLNTYFDISIQDADGFSEENCYAHRQIIRQYRIGSRESVHATMLGHIHSAGCFMRTSSSPPSPHELFKAMGTFGLANS